MISCTWNGPPGLWHYTPAVVVSGASGASAIGPNGDRFTLVWAPATGPVGRATWVASIFAEGTTTAVFLLQALPTATSCTSSPSPLLFAVVSAIPFGPHNA